MIPKKELINILRIWNYWDNEIEDLSERKEYQKNILNLRNAKEVIVLKGIRRSGKSTLLNLELKTLLKTTPKENLLFINFEEPRFRNYLNIEFLDYLFEAYLEYLEPKGKIYLFLDEIQNVEAWEKWVLRHYEKSNIQIYVTGSSSKLLSKEFSTALSGRHFSINVYPLSFKEFLDFKKIDISTKFKLISNEKKIEKEFKEYLKWGGFPKLLTLKNDLQKKTELINYYETIILKDIAERNKIKNTEELRNLIYYFLSNNTKLFSLNKLKKLNFGTFETIKNYLENAKDSYLLFELTKFDYSLKKQLVNLKKIYAIDTGFVNNIAFKFSQDIGRILENIVFIELKRRNQEIYYHKEKYECDFVIKERLDITFAIQVTKSLDDEDTKEREIKGLIEACKNYDLKSGLILTENEEGEEIIDDIKVIIKPVWKWLLIKNF